MAVFNPNKDAETGKLDISEMIGDIIAGRYSFFDLITSPPDEDYRAHVQTQQLTYVLMKEPEALKSLLRELEEKIAAINTGSSNQNSIEKELARKDGNRRFEKLMAQRAQAFAGTPSLLSGSDFDSCLTQYKTLLSHVEQLWASAAQLFKLRNLPISAFLSILVIEEIGKLARLHQDLVGYNIPRPPSLVRTVDRDHRRKHFIGVVSGALINARLDRILGKGTVVKLLHEAESDEFEKTRQNCLYVDVKDGNPVTPGQQIGEDRARVLVVLAGELMAEVLGNFPWEFERMIEAVISFEREIGIPESKIARS